MYKEFTLTREGCIKSQSLPSREPYKALIGALKEEGYEVLESSSECGFLNSRLMIGGSIVSETQNVDRAFERAIKKSKLEDCYKCEGNMYFTRV